MLRPSKIPSHAAIEESPEAVAKILAEGKVYNQQGEEVELSSNVSAEETALLHAAMGHLRPLASVEIGFAHGISTLAILDALRMNGSGHHHVIDPFQSRYGHCGCAMVERAGFSDLYTFYERHADEVIPLLPRLQFAFIDSSHLFDLTLSEFVLIDRKLDIGGVVGFHDLWMESQQALIRYLLANRAYEVWQPPDWPVQPEANHSSWKTLLRALLRRLPRGRDVFAREFLNPWQDFKLGNLVLLRKVADDSRDWRFHQRF